MREVRPFEPWFFILFGLFHLHRVWGLLDRESYAAFWLGVLTERGVFYWTLMAVLGGMCLWALALFFRCFRERCWWRWAYLCGGGYVLFDLFAIAADLPFWHRLLTAMFDTAAWYWNWLWSAFVVLGGACLLLGICLLRQRRRV